MLYVIFGMFTIVFVIFIGLSLINDHFDDPWRAVFFSFIGLFVVWYFVYNWQTSIDEDRAAEKTQRDAYYDKCISETEVIVNNITISHIKTNKCVP